MTDYAGQNHEQRMLDWHGLKPSRAARCLRVVLGRRCVAHNGFDRHCLCQTVQQHNLFDHVRVWLDAQGRYVLTSEPYNCTPGYLQELREDLAEPGIELRVSDNSPWCPGSTTLLLMTAVDAHARVVNRETLAIWLRACFLDTQTDAEDRIALGDLLNRMGVLPPETWMALDVELLGNTEVEELTAAVRAVLDRNNPIGEAMRNWETLHGHSFEDS